jgi:type IV fimbrial biogenesis protein FimT
MQSQKTFPLGSKARLLAQDETGTTLLQVVIVLAVIGIASTFAIVSFRSARANLRLQNSTRQLASYIEKARLDAIRRHDSSSVVFNTDNSYSVTMDFSGGGAVTTRTFQFEDGVSVFSTPLPRLTFNWRGRISRCTLTFAVKNSGGEQSYLDVSDAGDVTVNNDADVLPNANYATVNANSDVATTAVVSGTAVHNNALDCVADSSSAAPGPPITGGGPGCLDSANPSSVSIKKNGGGSTQITVTATNTGTVSVNAPINMKVTPTVQTVSGGSSVSFTVASLNNTRGTFAVNFTTPCTTLTVLVTVTN